ncbi:MAG TPA: chondroitin lyase, partial [Prolixibacteraceae bacterium]|nr:chondroitin lyase [Prolixibacteraceae bacterium]
YGAVAFDFKSPHDPLKAKKAWFFFDKEYVCLGTGIQSKSKLPVVTTLNQCLLNGDVVMMNENGKSILKQGEHEPGQVKWIFHDSIGYLFPEPQKVKLTNRAQTGSWYRVNRQSDSPKDEISMNVFKLWIDHGSQPQNGTYSYIIVPAATEAEMEQSTNNRDIEILANNFAIQAVKHSALNLCQIIFHTSGEIQLSGTLIVRMDSPGIVMIKDEGTRISAISVSDPSRKLGKIHLSVSEKIEKRGEGFNASWDPHEGVTQISVDLPQGVYAGKSVTINL